MPYHITAEGYTMFDLNYAITDPERISLCPLCDGPMFVFDETTVIHANDCKCLAHTSCAEDALGDGDDDEE